MTHIPRRIAPGQRQSHDHLVCNRAIAPNSQVSQTDISENLPLDPCTTEVGRWRTQRGVTLWCRSLCLRHLRMAPLEEYSQLPLYPPHALSASVTFARRSPSASSAPPRPFHLLSTPAPHSHAPRLDFPRPTDYPQTHLARAKHNRSQRGENTTPAFCPHHQRYQPRRQAINPHLSTES